MSPTLIHYQMHHSGLLPLLNCKLSLQNSGKTGSYQTISLINYSVIIYMHKNKRKQTTQLKKWTKDLDTSPKKITDEKRT